MNAVWIFLVIVIGSSEGQCPVSQPTITSKVLCQVSPPPLQGPSWGVSYTCNDPQSIVLWSGPAIVGDFTVSRWSGSASPILTISGVTVTEAHTSDSTCINSTLTFHGQNLNALDGLAISCRYSSTATITIMIPRVPETVDFASIQLLTDTRCNANSFGNVSLEWTQPNDTGGQGLDIEHYMLNITGPAEFTCPADQCNVTTTNTTITGLLCNTTYTVTIKAVNCVGESKKSSHPILINSSIPECTHMLSSYFTSTPASLLLFSTTKYTPKVSSSSSTLVTSTTVGPKKTDITISTQYTPTTAGISNAVGVSIGVTVPITIVCTTISLFVVYLFCVYCSCDRCRKTLKMKEKSKQEVINFDNNMAYGAEEFHQNYDKKCISDLDEGKYEEVSVDLIASKMTNTNNGPIYESVI